MNDGRRGLTWATSVEQDLGDPHNPPADTYAEPVIVDKCNIRDGRWDIDAHTPDGRTVGFAIRCEDLAWPRDQQSPKPGDPMTIYCYHGTATVGFDLRGERLFLRSEREENLHWLLFRARYERERGLQKGQAA